MSIAHARFGVYFSCSFFAMASRPPVDKETLRREWYEQLASLLSDLECLNKDYLDDSDLLQLGISTSPFDIELDDIADDSGPRFFTPFHRDHLKVSSCVIQPCDHRTLGSRFGFDNVDCGAYHWGRDLAAVIGAHLRDVRWMYSSKWKFVR